MIASKIYEIEENMKHLLYLKNIKILLEVN